MKRWSRRAAAIGVGLTLSVGGWVLWSPSRAEADLVDPNLPVSITIGHPPGFSPMARVDSRRTGRVEALPDAPKQKWHRRVRGGMSLPVAIDQDGAIIVAAAVAEMVQVKPDGSEQWHRRLGMSVASTQPVIMADGTRVVLTALGQAWGFGPQGEARFKTSLATLGTDPRTSPLPREDGTLVVGVGTHLVTLDRQGTIVSHEDLGERVVGAILEGGNEVIATTETGAVFRWASPMAPRRVGTFRGMIREGAAMAPDGSLQAVVDMQRLVSMDTRTGATSTRLNVYGLEGPPTIGEQSLIHISTTSGSLLSVSPAGEERRVKLIPSLPAADADAGVPVVAYAPASPAVIVDDKGRIAFARTDGRVGVVSPEGQVRYAPKRGCGTPVSILPAGKGSFLVACRTGDLRLYGR